MKLKFSLLLLLGAFKQFAFAQIDNSMLSQNIAVHETDSGKLGFTLDVFNYMRNTEYFNNIELGRTLFGYQVSPALHYQVNKHVKIQGGAFIRHDFGGEIPFTTVLPTFTLKTSYNHFHMLLGTLEGATAHQIIEPMFDIARAIENRVENGFQLKYVTDKTFFDTWVNWEKFIERKSPHKEMVTTGLNYTQLVTPVKNKFKVHLIGQGMLSHTGGQIDKDTVTELTVQINYTFGFKLAHDLRKNEQVSLEGYYLVYNALSPSSKWDYNNGAALYGHVGYKYQGFHAMLSFFYSHNYVSPRGTAIYQGQSIDRPTYFTSSRTLLIPRIMYNKKLFNQLQTSARIEPVVDLDNSIFDYSFSFYLSYQLEKIFR